MGRPPVLTKEQVHVTLQRWTARHGRAPSLEDLRRELRVASTRTVFRYLQLLEADGVIERRPGKTGIKLLRPMTDGVLTKAVPIAGRVPAGAPMLAEQNIEGWLRLPQSMLKPTSDTFFLLRVRGTSMNKAQIEGGVIDDGDLVLVRRQSSGRPGDIVVACVDGAATVKRLVFASGYCVLRPESRDSKHQPIVVDQDLRIQGVVKCVLKDAARLVFDEGRERS